MESESMFSSIRCAEQKNQLEESNVSSVMDVEELMTTFTSTKPKRRSSLFNLPIEVCLSGLSTPLFSYTHTSSNEQDSEHLEYIKSLQDEQLKWIKVLKDKKTQIKKAEGKYIEIGKSILSSSQLEYIEWSTKIHEYVKNSIEFTSKAESYLQEHSEMVKLYSHLEQVKKEILERKALILIRDFIETDRFLNLN